MEKAASIALKKILAENGTSVLDNPQKLEFLLRDNCGSLKKEINLLLLALVIDIPKDILMTEQVTPERIRLLAQRIIEDFSVTLDAAFWVVEAWANALNAFTLNSVRAQSESEITPEKIAIFRKLLHSYDRLIDVTHRDRQSPFWVWEDGFPIDWYEYDDDGYRRFQVPEDLSELSKYELGVQLKE